MRRLRNEMQTQLLSFNFEIEMKSLIFRLRILLFPRELFPLTVYYYLQNITKVYFVIRSNGHFQGYRTTAILD